MTVSLAAGDAYRNMPQHWKVKELIDSGELGQVESINLYQSTTEISGGGCQGLSVLRLFAGDADVDWVTGWCGGDPQDDGDQNMGGCVKFANGVDGFIHSKRTPLEGIFAAGDVVRVSSVIEALGAAKRAASAILRYLRGQDGETPARFERPVARWSREELEGWVHRSRQEPPLLPLRRRAKGFSEVEHAFTAEQALVEAKWEAVLKFKTEAPDVYIDEGGISTCAFCAAYFIYRCLGCPVAQATGELFYDGSPYQGWMDDQTVQRAQMELDFLRSLRQTSESENKEV